MADSQLPNCNQEVFDHGVSVGLFVIPKETAEAICLGISAATGARVDWHYIAGRVHIKALPATPSPPVTAVPATPVAPADAVRYQWLRRWKGQEHEPLFTVRHEIEGTLWGPDLDAAIDAAMLDPAYVPTKATQPQSQPAQPLTGALPFSSIAPLSDEHLAIRAACSQIIKSLAAIVNSPLTDEQVFAELVPRNPLMVRVQEIKGQVDAINKILPMPIHPMMRATYHSITAPSTPTPPEVAP